MKAVLFEKFREEPKLVTVEDPTPDPHGVVLRVAALDDDAVQVALLLGLQRRTDVPDREPRQ